MARTAGRMARIQTDLQGLTKRFPAVLALSCVASLIGLLQVFDVPGASKTWDVFDYVLGSGISPDALTLNLVGLLRSGCEFALPIVVAAQCAFERAQLRTNTSRLAQVVCALVCAAVYVIGAHVASAASRGALFLMAMMGIDAMAVCLAVFLLADKGNEEALVPRVCIAVLFAGLLCSLLNGGLGIICLVVDLLFGLEDLAGRLFMLATVLSWTFLYPNLVVAQLPQRDDELAVPKAWNVIVGSVVLPLCLLLLGVLYLYIGRIVLTRQIPVGEMNWFGCFALVVYLFLLLGVRSVKNPLSRWFVCWGWALLIPVVAAQIVGVAIRVGAYGLTPARYASCLLIGAGVGSAAIAALGQGRVRASRTLLLVAAAFGIACLSPANLLDVANFSQVMRLDKGQEALEAEAPRSQGGAESVDEAKLQVAEAWDYLRSSADGYFTFPQVEDLRQKAQDGATFKDLFGFERPMAQGDAGDSRQQTWWTVEYNADDVALDVAGFSRVYRLHDAQAQNADDLHADGDTTLSAAWDDGTSLDVDLKDLFDQLAAYEPGVLVSAPEDGGYRQQVDVPADFMRVDAGEGRVLAIKQVERSVDLDESEADRVDVAGYLLVP